MRSRLDVPTVLGLVAIVIWSSNIAVCRSLAEKVGSLTSGSLMFLIGGTLGWIHASLGDGRGRRFLRLPAGYLCSCGLLFVAYMVCLYLALGLAVNRQQAIEVGILNYLWPGLTLAFSVPILGVRVRPPFFAGIALALAGATLAPLQGGHWSFRTLQDNLCSHPLPYLLAAAAGVLWALYSVMCRRWAGEAEEGALPLFAVASGVVLGLIRLWWPEPTNWDGGAVAELLFMALLPILLAYSFWDTGMRCGNLTLLAAVAYLIPLFSTLISGLYLGVGVGWNVWAACFLIVSGAVLCEVSVIKGHQEMAAVPVR